MRPGDDWLEMLAEFVHDMRTPISAARGYIELMQAVGPLNEKQDKYADRAVGAIQQLERLVLNMLDVAWLDADKPLQLGVCDLKVLINEVIPFIQGLAERRGIAIDVQLSSTLGLVVGDARRLSAVLYNLTENAVKYSDENGSVTIRAYGMAESVTMSVRDSGVGIAPEEHARVFERFYRSEATSGGRVGSGLGLAIVKEIIEKHGGRVTLDSALRQGSTFTVVLPRVPPGAEAMVSAAEIESVLRHADHGDYFDGEPSEISDAVDDDTQESVDDRRDIADRLESDDHRDVDTRHGADGDPV
jgi:two-component system OmpR family sensor kinase